MTPDRRRLLQWAAAPVALGGLVALAGCKTAPRVYDMRVSRDLGCTCCHAWAEAIEKTGRFKLAVSDDPDLPALKKRLGVPAGLGACHTAVVDQYVIEGHVQAEDILKLLETRPAGVRGLAVPGMPRGSPGMEQPNGVKDAYTVVSFTAEGEQKAFATYAGNP